MTKALSFTGCLFLVLIFGHESGQQPIQEKLIAEGPIIAFQKKERCPSCEPANELGTRVEFWIVRIDKWVDNPTRGERYVLVTYNLYQRGLSDREINSDRLRFTLRERREDEYTDCLGMVLIGDKAPYTRRAVRLSDYERTKPGRLDEIPPLKSLPCFIADNLPVVIVDN